MKKTCLCSLAARPILVLAAHPTLPAGKSVTIRGCNSWLTSLILSSIAFFCFSSPSLDDGSAGLGSLHIAKLFSKKLFEAVRLFLCLAGVQAGARL